MSEGTPQSDEEAAFQRRVDDLEKKGVRSEIINELRNTKPRPLGPLDHALRKAVEENDGNPLYPTEQAWDEAEARMNRAYIRGLMRRRLLDEPQEDESN